MTVRRGRFPDNTVRIRIGLRRVVRMFVLVRFPLAFICCFLGLNARVGYVRLTELL